MSIEKYLHEMPKVELNVHLEGAIVSETLLTIAEQNEVGDSMKQFNYWANLLRKPDFARLDEIIITTSRWIQQPEDLAHITYELGVMLAKQNIRYAEVHVSPNLYVENGFSFEDFLTAINDGRDRAQRAWGVQMSWILNILRSQPRSADEIARWATGPAAKRGRVIGISLSGREDIQPPGQFERAFRTAARKDLLTAVEGGERDGAEGIQELIEALIPQRIIGGAGVAAEDAAVDTLLEKQIVLEIGLTRAVSLGQVAGYAEFPLRQLLDDGVSVVLSCDMPSYYKSGLSDEYVTAARHCGLSLDEVEALALGAVSASQLPASEKEKLAASFVEEYARLRAEYLPV